MQVVVKDGGMFGETIKEAVSVPEVTQQGLERQIEDVFSGDIGQLREYCKNEPAYNRYFVLNVFLQY